MSWNVHIIRRKTKTYAALKKNKREGSKVRSSYIYLGPIIEAVKILADLQIKPLIDEKEISYSGEIILGKIANSISMSKVLEKYTGDKRVAEALMNIIILRALFPESKRKLVKIRLEHSILKYSTDMRYFEEVYQFMDTIYDNLGDVTYDLIKNALKKYRLDLKYLIIDATRIKIWKDKETGLVRFGYSSGNELKNLPQVNLVLGVNSQQIPLFANTYPGNTSDVKMFEDFIRRINTRYLNLTQKVKDKFIIFDQGNVNEDNIEYLRTFKKDGIHFVSMVRTNSTPRFIKEIDKSSMSLIYSSEKSKNERTCIYGTLIDGDVYEKRSRVLVCYNPDLMNQRWQTMDRRVAEVTQAVEDGGSLEDVLKLISKYNLKRALKPVEEGGKLKLVVNETEISARKEHYGFFTLFTDHRGLSAEEIIAIYKSRNLVEDGFRALKSDSKIDPVYHSKDMRIETHTVLVVSGYLLTSLLRAILKSSGMEYSFGGLKDTIKSGNAVEGFYEHEKLRNRLYIYRPVKPAADLEAILERLKIKVPTFDVKEVIPTNNS